MRVVLIEDDPSVAKLMVQILEKAGHIVTWAPDAVTGIETVTRDLPDLVLSDIRMATHFNGFGIVTLLKRDIRTQHIPVVAVTGFAVPGEDKQYTDLGFAGVIPKPFDVASFAAAIEAFKP